jgi:hypothetical protein
MNAAPIPFPSKLGTETSRQQFEALKHMSSRELLHAIVTKYPGITFTADELHASQGQTVEVRAVADNEWVIVPEAKMGRIPE